MVVTIDGSRTHKAHGRKGKGLPERTRDGQVRHMQGLRSAYAAPTQRQPAALWRSATSPGVPAKEGADAGQHDDEPEEDCELRYMCSPAPRSCQHQSRSFGWQRQGSIR